MLQYMEKFLILINIFTSVSQPVMKKNKDHFFNFLNARNN